MFSRTISAWVFAVIGLCSALQIQASTVTHLVGSSSIQEQEHNTISSIEVLMPTSADGLIDVDAVLRDVLGASVSMEIVQAIKALLINAYQQHGWVVAVTVPPQEVVGGKLLVEVMPTKVGAIQLDGSITDSEFIVKVIEDAVVNDEYMNLALLDSGLGKAARLPGVMVSGSLTSGDVVGTTDVLLMVNETPVDDLLVSVNNYGGESSGVAQLGVSYDLVNPENYRNRYKFNTSFSSGSQLFTVDFSRWLLPNGLALDMGLNASQYEVQDARFKSLDLHGDSQGINIGLSSIFLQGTRYQIDVDYGLNFKQFANYSGQLITSDYQVAKASLSAQGDLKYSNYQANTLYNLGYSFGNLSADSYADSSYFGTFHKLTWDINHHVQLGQKLQFSAGVEGQLSSTNLDSSEKFYLGGQSSIQAYGSSEVGGDQGYFVNFQADYQLLDGVVLKAFVQQGYVQINRNNGSIQADPNKYVLRGKGLGAVWSAPYGIVVDASWSSRIGSNPNPNVDGNDQNGSLIKDRFWLSLSRTF